jgi:hypoxanthine phosphoribosyltransferase
MYDYLRPSYEEIHNACKDIADRINVVELGITQVVGIARGGLLPAVILSHMLDLPLLLADYSSKNGNGDDKNHRNVLPEVFGMRGTLLIVDDICDSGKTLKEIVDHFTSVYIPVFTAVLYHKTHDNQPIVPDYVWKIIPHDSDWVIFPYERNEFLAPDYKDLS